MPAIVDCQLSGKQTNSKQYKRFLSFFLGGEKVTSEPRHDKTNKVTVRPAKTQISLGIHWAHTHFVGFVMSRLIFSFTLYTPPLDGSTTNNVNEPPHDKTNKMACAPSEDSDQPGHPPSQIRVFAVRMKEAWVLSYPLSAQRRL